MFHFNWNLLDRRDEQAAMDFLNRSFAALSKPDFVGAVSVSDLSLGDEPPVVQLLGITGLSEETKEWLGGEVEEYGETDVEVAVQLTYRGNLSFKVHTELVINFPVPDFGRLPITLAVTRLELDGTARLIKAGDRVFMTFDEDEDDLGPLKLMRVDSEIGVKDEPESERGSIKPVLKNATKVEEFIVEQLRTIVLRRVVFPNCIDMSVDGRR